MKILLIDDDVDLCQLTLKVLTKHGYDVDAFQDATQGIEHARRQKPDLILMDIMMPGLSGPEIATLLKKEDHFRFVPIVFLTGLVDASETGGENDGLMVGGVKYRTLGKPYEIDNLLAMVEAYDRGTGGD
ncbi:MAG: response regulator [Candidatus Omnitrophica bacterium]|nr:response regulator [Candidatus Omnitrophota bacterium]MDE2009591.1 response regulator [Candidatus Omnitrophota bacterium]MDE2214481.1 response regulator [Candidatus Omnitrophota bacterium]MDE2231621.1 response regulator [Candidatus Omnitrophota bacterium]